MSDKTEKIKNNVQKVRGSFKNYTDSIQGGGKHLVITVIVTFIVMIIVCLSAFFLTVQGAEKVMVPNVTGKKLPSALLEMQAKELYPRIQLKYSDTPGDAGTILDQNPGAGAIVKAYQFVTLTVSRGIQIDEVEDYTGKNLDTVIERLEALYAGEEALVKIAPPAYQKDASAPGTIIAQTPEAGTPIDSAEGIELQFIVSSGNSR